MAAPSAPNVSVIAITETTATLAWPTPADGGSALTTYSLTQGTPPTFASASPSAVAAPANYATFTGLTPGSIIHLRVAANNGDGASGPSVAVVRTANGATSGAWLGDGAGFVPLGGLCVNFDEPTLHIGTVNLASRSLWAFDLLDALLGSDLLGSNGAMPDYPGTFPNRQRQTETTYDFPLLIDSQVDPATGLDYVGLTPMREFLRTLAYLRNNCIDPGSARTVTATLFHPDGYVLTRPCQMQRLVKSARVEAVNEAGRMTMSMTGVLKVRFPFGGFNLP